MQLTLLTNSEITSSVDKGKRSSRKAAVAPKTGQLSRKSSRKSQAWWRLSESEKQAGLNGIQNIRAILQKSTLSPGEMLAQAS